MVKNTCDNRHVGSLIKGQNSSFFVGLFFSYSSILNILNFIICIVRVGHPIFFFCKIVISLSLSSDFNFPQFQFSHSININLFLFHFNQPFQNKTFFPFIFQYSTFFPCHTLMVIPSSYTLLFSFYILPISRLLHMYKISLIILNVS